MEKLPGVWKCFTWCMVPNQERSTSSMLPACSFNLYTGCILRNAGLDEAQAGIKTTGGNINNFRYTDDTTFMAESEEKLKSILMKVKEESEKAVLKLSIQK